MQAYAVIGGTTKSATTSLFRYLGDHPDVCAASLKETRFFLPASYGLPQDATWRRDGIAGIETYFRHCGGEKLRLEATPDYLYSVEAAHDLRAAIPHARVVFVLREPVARFISWFRFARQNGLISAQTTLRDFLAQQAEAGSGAPQHLRALEQGRYAAYLPAWLEAFPGRVRVLFTEELERDPNGSLAELAAFLDIDPSFYRDYAIERHNRTYAMRSSGLHKAYVRARSGLRRRVHGIPLVHGALRALRRRFEPLYLKLNRTGEGDGLPRDVGARLAEYYRADRAELATLLGRPLPWGDA